MRSAELPYAELQVTTNYSFLRGGSHPGELVHRAIELGHSAIVEVLLGRGADRTIADKNGKCAADLAANESVLELLVAR